MAGRRAFLALHHPEHAELFAAGLKAAGWEVSHRENYCPGDILVIWNRMLRVRHLCVKAEKAGARVLVVENGYTGSREKLFAIALDHHNGAGTWHVGTESRWEKQGIVPSPWRKDGTHVLVLGQRGIGELGVAMPRGWADEAAGKLRKMTRRPIRLRRHPGRDLNPTPLEDDLRDAWCAVTWASGAAVKAIVSGVPVFHGLPAWIGREAAKPFGENIERPYLGPREPMLHRLSWAQWLESEVREGQPFTCLPI